MMDHIQHTRIVFSEALLVAASWIMPKRTVESKWLAKALGEYARMASAKLDSMGY